MTPKERMLTALNLEKPDRLPVTTLGLMPYWRKTEMDGRGEIECYRELGLDASASGPWPYDLGISSPQWKVSFSEVVKGRDRFQEYAFETPAGTLKMKQGANEYTVWCTEHMVKNDEDIYLLKYRPVPSYQKEVFAKLYDELGDGGILRAGGTFGFQEGCWQDACELHGTENMIMAVYDKPEWVHEFLGILLDQKLKFIEASLPGLKVDLLLMGGGASSNTVISPKIHEAFCLPYDRKMNEAVKSYGHKVVYHTCGGMTKILNHILANECDASESLSPASGGGDITDPGIVREQFKGKVAMIGGFDQIYLLQQGTPEEIRKEVYRLFEGFGRDGGYIMMTCDHFFHAPLNNVREYVKAAKECSY